MVEIMESGGVVMITIRGTGELVRFLTRHLSEPSASVIISGASGIGKSDAIQEVASQLKLPVWEERLYLMDIGEAKGLPDIDLEKLETRWTRPDWLPRRACVLFFDDIHLCNEIIQGTLFELLLCGTLHRHSIHKECRIVACGNLGLEAAGANKILAPIMDRFDIGIELEPTVDDWVVWARAHQIQPRIVSFLLAEPGKLYTADPPPSQKFASPRSWARLDRLMKRQGFGIDIAPGVVGPDAGAAIQNMWPLLSRPLEELLEMDCATAADEVILASALTQWDPTERILRRVLQLHPEPQLLYCRTVFRRMKWKEIEHFLEKVPAIESVLENLIDVIGEEDNGG